MKENSRVTKYELQLGRTHFTVCLHYDYSAILIMPAQAVVEDKPLNIVNTRKVNITTGKKTIVEPEKS